MSDYLALFFEDFSQLRVLLLVAVVWVALAALGSRIAGAAEKIFYPFLGWGVVVVVFTVLGTFTDIGFAAISLGLGIVAILSAVSFCKRDRWLIDPAFLLILVWAAPLLLLVSAMAGSQWDEFSHWLLGQKYLLQVDHFPGLDRPKSAATYPAYPYAWQLLSYFVGKLNGSIVENAGSLFNVLLLLCLGQIAVGQAIDVSGRGRAAISPWLLASLAAASATIANPTFVQKVVLTAYADVATSVTLAVGVVIGWSVLEALSKGDLARARARALMSGLVFAILVSLKQSTLELFGVAVIALFLCGLLQPKVKMSELVFCTALTVIPAIFVYGMWRHYVANELSGREFVIRPFADWNFDLLPLVLTKMLGVLLKKGAFLFAMLLALVVGIRSLFRPSTTYSRAMLVIALVFLAHTAFLAFCYIAVFNGFEARSIASYWRYNQQLGGLAILAITMSGGVFVVRIKDRFPIGKVRWLPAVLIVIGPVIFAEKLRFDAEPTYAHYRAVARDAAEHIGEDATVRILDPKGSGESGMMMRYEVSEKTRDVYYQAAYHNMSEKALGDFLSKLPTAFILVHSVTPDLVAAIGVPLEQGKSYLLKRLKSGDVQMLQVWTWPDIDN